MSSTPQSRARRVRVPGLALIDALGAGHPVELHVTTLPDVTTGAAVASRLGQHRVRISVADASRGSDDVVIWHLPIGVDGLVLLRALSALLQVGPPPADVASAEEE
jgi:hypothetical protein